MKQLIGPDEARQHIAKYLPRIGITRKALTECTGSVLRETIMADRPFPPFDRSMMDGYSLRAAVAETGAVIEIVGRAPAGEPRLNLSDQPHSAVEIMTGAMIPTGADCVIPYEHTRQIDETHFEITDENPIASGDFVHAKGSDFSQGKALLEEGRRIGSREIAAAATCGYTELSVSQTPRIAIACSGDELVEIASAPAAHQIRRSNDYSVESALHAASLNETTRHHLPDDSEQTRERLEDLIEKHNTLILCGGISMGKKDFIPSVLDALGFTCHFHGIAQKPGKPMGFWTRGPCSVFALPGNPLSTLTCLHHYVIPAIQSAVGLKVSAASPSVTLSASSTVRKDLTVFLPVSLGPNNTGDPRPAQNSGDLARILNSDGYIAVPSGEAQAEAGKSYMFHPWY